MSGTSAFLSVHALKAFEGRLYLGYGDWNVHPAILMGSYRPGTGRWHVEHSVFTDSIGSFKEINGHLYVPHIDPVHYEDFKDFTYFSNGVWRDAAPLGLLHVFDMATLTGTDLWCVGSRTDYGPNGGGAAVYRSLDGGRTWQDKTVPTSVDRYYYCFARGGKLHVSDTVYDENGVGERISASSSVYVAKTRTIQVGTNELLLALDMQTPGLAITGPVQVIGTGQSGFDYAWDGNWVYVLKADGIYRRAFPYVTGEVFTRMSIDGMPANPRSMEVMDGTVYVADALGVLWGARLDGGPFSPPPSVATNELPDEFGRALAVDGNTMAVGAPGGFVRNAFLAGQVTIWDYLPSMDGGSNWIKTATIDPPLAMISGWFGKHLALKGDVLAVVEAGRDATMRDRGALAQLHVYQRTATNWVKRQSLNHSFAHSVAIDGDLLALSHILVWEPIPGSRITSPRSVVYRLSRTNDVVSLQQVAVFQTGGNFYEPVARAVLESNVIAQSVSGDVSRLGGTGSAIIREQLLTGPWMLTNWLAHSDVLANGTSVYKPDRFGFSLAMKNGWLAAGAPRDDQAAQDAGAVYLYQRVALPNGNLSFVEMQKLLPPEPQPEGAFGTALAMTESRLIVGSPGMDAEGEQNRGQVYVYERDGTNWVLIGKMQRPSASTVEFGIAVAADKHWMTAGSRFSNASSNLTDRVAVQPHLSPYTMWAAYHGLEGANAALSADGDGDGADNLAEYGYHLDPQNPDADPVDSQNGNGGLPVLHWVKEEGGTFVEITRVQHRHPDLMDLSYSAEVSTDLLNWTAAEEPSTHVISINAEWERLTLRFPATPSQVQLFYKLKLGFSQAP